MESIPGARRVPTVRQLEQVTDDYGFGALGRQELEDAVQQIQQALKLKRGLTPEQQRKKDAVVMRQAEELRQRKLKKHHQTAATSVDGDGAGSPVLVPRTFSGEVAYKDTTSARAQIRQMMR
jgi:hypothetical protein